MVWVLTKCWSATSEYKSKMHACGHKANSSQMNWHITAIGCWRWRWCFFFSFTDVTLTFQQFLASGWKFHYTVYNDISENYTVSTSTSSSAWSCKGPDCKTVRTTSFLLFPSPVSLSPTFLLHHSSLPVHLSHCVCFFPPKLLQEPAKLHCPVTFTLTSQPEWHTGYNLTTLKLQHYYNRNSLVLPSKTSTQKICYNPYNVQKQQMYFN